MLKLLRKLKLHKQKNKIKSISQIQNAGKKKLRDPIIFACLFILMGDVLELSVIKAHHFEMHNIKEGHDVKASVGDTFVNYAEDFKKTKTAEAKNKNKNLFAQIQNVGKKKLPDPIIFACLFILMGDVLDLSSYESPSFRTCLVGFDF
jgi:hypothetical protein